MRTRSVWRPAKWIIVLGLSIPLASAAVASDKGWAAVNQVDPNMYQGFLNNWLYTHSGNDRGFFPLVNHDAAADNIQQLFEEYGWSVTVDEFKPFLLVRKGYNVVATKLGTVPEEYIIGAHYDSFEDLAHASLRYPGADDNASGVAALLEIARILGPYPSYYTIRLIAFDWEEWHWGGQYDYMFGSWHYATEHASPEQTRGMISLDMIAWNDPNDPDHARVCGEKESRSIKNSLAAAITEYGCGLTGRVLGPDPYSDHARFEAEGIPACVLTENEGNDRYHTPDDDYEHIASTDFTYAVKMTRSALGWLVDAAGVNVPVNLLRFTYPYGRPLYMDPRGGTRMRVVVSGLGNETPAPGTGWCHFKYGGVTHHQQMLQREPNVYEALLPTTSCGTHCTYWLSAAAQDGTAYTDPPGGVDAPYLVTATFGRVSVGTYWPYPDWVDPLWEWGQPAGLCGDPDLNYDIWGYNLDGCYENNVAERRFELWNIDCAGQQDVHLSFQRWLNVECPFWDHAAVRVSDNWYNWTTAWENTTEVADTQWANVDLDISAVADDKPGIFLRWTMGPTDSLDAFGGWNLDAVDVTAARCTPPYAQSDMNCDGTFGLGSFADINPFVLALSDPSAYAASYPDCYFMNADMNCDGDIDFGDINPFVACLSYGDCDCP